MAADIIHLHRITAQKNISPVNPQVARLGKEAALMDAGQGVGQVTARATENALVGKIDSF